jgi:hypothetical protein
MVSVFKDVDIFQRTNTMTYPTKQKVRLPITEPNTSTDEGFVESFQEGLWWVNGRQGKVTSGRGIKESREAQKVRA